MFLLNWSLPERAAGKSSSGVFLQKSHQRIPLSTRLGKIISPITTHTTTFDVKVNTYIYKFVQFEWTFAVPVHLPDKVLTVAVCYPSWLTPKRVVLRVQTVRNVGVRVCASTDGQRLMRDWTDCADTIRHEVVQHTLSLTKNPEVII